jgi:putative endonuclease
MLRFLQRFLPGKAPANAGDQGEQLAAEWLQRERRFAIVTRNWRNPKDRREEIDLVCRDADVLVFVEVKARAAAALVPGYYAVDRRKKKVLQRAIGSYLRLLREKPRTFRFDVVEISLAGATTQSSGANSPDASATPQVLHFENVPLFSKYFRG